MDFLFTVRLGNPKKDSAKLFSWTVVFFLLSMRARARPLFFRTVFQILFRISQSNGKNENPKTDLSALKSVFGFRVRLQIRNPDFKNLNPDFPIERTRRVDRIHVWFKIANITHALPVPVYRQTDLTPKRVVVSRLHDTGTTTGMNWRRGDSRRLDILWWYHANKCRTMRGNRSELAPTRKSRIGLTRHKR